HGHVTQALEHPFAVVLGDVGAGARISAYVGDLVFPRRGDLDVARVASTSGGACRQQGEDGPRAPGSIGPRHRLSSWVGPARSPFGGMPSASRRLANVVRATPSSRAACATTPDARARAWRITVCSA